MVLPEFEKPVSRCRQSQLRAPSCLTFLPRRALHLAQCAYRFLKIRVDVGLIRPPREWPHARPAVACQTPEFAPGLLPSIAAGQLPRPGQARQDLLEESKGCCYIPAPIFPKALTWAFADGR